MGREEFAKLYLKGLDRDWEKFRRLRTIETKLLLEEMTYDDYVDAQYQMFLQGIQSRMETVECNLLNTIVDEIIKQIRKNQKEANKGWDGVTRGEMLMIMQKYLGL